MLFSKTMILGLLGFLTTQATSHPVELDNHAETEVPTLTCIYSYNAIYDWYIIRGKGWGHRDRDANIEIKQCAKDAGAPTGWLQRDTDNGNGEIEVQFRLELGLPRGKLQRCLAGIYPRGDGREVKCKRVSRKGQHIESDIFGPEK